MKVAMMGVAKMREQQIMLYLITALVPYAQDQLYFPPHPSYSLLKERNSVYIIFSSYSHCDIAPVLPSAKHNKPDRKQRIQATYIWDQTRQRYH